MRRTPDGVPPLDVTTVVFASLTLSLARSMTQLRDGLVDESVSVSTAFRQLAAVGIHGQFPVEGNPASLVEPVLRLAEPAESK